MLAVIDKGTDNKIEIDEKIRSTTSGSITVEGSGHRIRMAPFFVSPDLKTRFAFSIQGTGHDIEFVGGGAIKTTSVFMMGSNCRLTIDRDTTLNANGSFLLHEPSSIYVGKDCMFSGFVRIQTSDMHSIVDVNTKVRINPARDISIGDHVWVGLNAIIMKGSDIGSGSIIGANALVAGTIPPNSIAAGIPARVIRSDVTWDRKLL